MTFKDSSEQKNFKIVKYAYADGNYSTVSQPLDTAPDTSKDDGSNNDDSGEEQNVKEPSPPDMKQSKHAEKATHKPAVSGKKTKRESVVAPNGELDPRLFLDK